MNSISYSICLNPDLSPKLSWFCGSRLLQFVFTIVVPFILLMVWQNGEVWARPPAHAPTTTDPPAVLCC